MQKSLLLDRIKSLARPIHPERFDHSTKLGTLNDIKCVAFDFYGTMFISGVGDIGVDEEQKSAYKEIFKKALIQSSFSILQPAVGKKGLQQFQAIIEQHIKEKRDAGISYPEPDILNIWKQVLAALVQLNLIKGPITKDQTVRFAIEFEFRANTIWPVPDLEAILNDLLSRNLKLGIISNSQFYTPLAFEAIIGKSTNDFGFDSDLQKWSYVKGIKKPSVEFYQQFTDELPAKDLLPREVLYVGNDLFKDIIPAKKLNMKTALYVGDRRSLRHEQTDLAKPAHQPDIIIDDLHQITRCLA